MKLKLMKRTFNELYSDSILQIMTLYVRDTGKISIYFSDSKSLWKGTVDMKLRDTCSLEEKQ